MDILPPDMPDRHICILGMGFVGVTLSAVMAQIGFQVTGVEIRKDLVENLNGGRAHFFEPGLTEQLTAAVLAGRLRTFEDIPADCEANVYVITVGTPLGADGSVDLTSIINISRQIANRLKDDDLVILRSTVRLGVTRNVVKPILDAAGKAYELAFCPERSVEGQAMAEQRVLPQIIGADDFNTGLRAASLFQHITPTVVRVRTTETAEMIKLIDNASRDVMFAYANEIALMCEAVGISADEVIRSGRFGYSRSNLPRPGPVGGPCLSKDSHILCESFEPYGVDSQLTRAARRVNERIPVDSGIQIGNWIKKHRPAGSVPVISILGVAFKGRPATDDIRGTTVSAVVGGLNSVVPDVKLQAFDPVVPHDLIRSLGLTPLNRVEEAFVQADVVLIHTDHPSFLALPMNRLTGSMHKPALVYDFWNLFSEMGIVLDDGVIYRSLGGGGTGWI